MANFDIGLSGIDAAQVALEVIGNNVANAATEGYHRQRVELVPTSHAQTGGLAESGVEVASVMRLVDGNKTKAAKILGIDRKSLYRKLERFSTVRES